MALVEYPCRRYRAGYGATVMQGTIAMGARGLIGRSSLAMSAGVAFTPQATGRGVCCGTPVFHSSAWGWMCSVCRSSQGESRMWWFAGL
jgi:hypothetical protein